MSAADDSPARPQPTAHEVEPGCTLSRRDALKMAAFTAAALAGGTASSGTVSADSGLADGLVEAIGNGAVATGYGTNSFGLGVFVGAMAVGSITSNLNTSPSADRLQLHQLVHNEIEWMESHHATFGNHMQDSRPIASLEARHEIASAWEEGAGSSTAYDRALSRIRQYYELPEFNHLHSGNKALLQLSYIAGSGYDTDPEYDLVDIVEDGSGNTLQMRLTDERQDVELTLHNGTVVDENAFDNIDHIEGAEGVVTTPVFDFIDTSDGTIVDSQPITQSVLDSWDSADETVAFTIDGTEYRCDLRLTTQNVGDASEDPSLASLRAFDGREWIRQLNEVEQLSNSVVSNYTNDFVSDIYAELDAGNITPEQVRSPEGMARYLSGTDDTESERFQIAWMQQFGFERADMSVVRGMSVTWAGATDTWVNPDSSINGRHTHPDGYVDGKEYSGVLFGSETTADIQAGGSYAIGPPALLFDGAGVRSFSAVSGKQNWGTDGVSSSVGGAVTADGKTVFVGTTDNDIIAIDTSDGQQKWTFAAGNPITSVHLSPDESTVYVGTNNELYSVDASTGNQNWTDSSYNVGSLDVSQDGETLFMADTSGDQVVSLATADQSQNWAYSATTVYPNTIELSNDGNTLYVGTGGNSTDDSELHAVNAADGTALWGTPYVTGTYDVLDIAVSDEDETVYFGVYNSLRAVGADGTEQWVDSSPSNEVQAVELAPDDSYLYYAAGDFNAIDPSDRSQKWSQSVVDGTPRDLLIPTTKDVDGMAARSVMFDEDAGRQVDLWHGVVEVNEMWDADEAEITHVSDQTITDIESLSSTPDDIETIVSEMDEFDSREDIKYTRDVQLILENYGAEDQEDQVTTEEPDYRRPEYDSYDSSKFAEEMASLEEKIDQLEDENADDGEEEDDGGLGIGLPFDLSGDAGGLLGLGLIGVVVLAVVGIVTDAIPGLGN